jgi:iron complex transport system substrate-binding protein
MRFFLSLICGVIMAVGAKATDVPPKSLPLPPPPPPTRAISLNLCADQLLWLLLEREQIAGLSFLAADRQLSPIADAIGTLPLLHGGAEEALALRPDVALVGRQTTQATAALLRAHGVRVVDIDMAETFPAIRAQILTLGQVLRRDEAAAALVASMDATLAAIRNDPPPPLSILSLAPGGFTPGSGSLADAVITAAGLRNHATMLGIVGYGYARLEAIIAHPPDALVVQGRSGTDAPSLAHQLLEHPALERALDPSRRLSAPEADWTCGGPYAARAALKLAEAARRSGLAPRKAASFPVPQTNQMP